MRPRPPVDPPAGRVPLPPPVVGLLADEVATRLCGEGFLAGVLVLGGEI